jgi:hypothetical protein
MFVPPSTEGFCSHRRLWDVAKQWLFKQNMARKPSFHALQKETEEG